MKTLKYFIECYFNCSPESEDLNELVTIFISNESYDNIVLLKTDIEAIITQSEWNLFVSLLRVHGGRKVSEKRVQELSKQIYSQLDQY